MRTNRMVDAAKTVIDRAKNKRPTSGVVYGIDSDRVDIRLDNSSAILRHIRVVGDINTVVVGDVIELQWGSDGRPVAIVSDAESLAIVADNDTIEHSDGGMRVKSGGIQRHHIGFVLPDERTFTDLLSQAGWKINPDSGVISNSNISISPHGSISVGEGHNIIKMSSYGIPDDPNSPEDDTDYRMWVGHTYPYAAGFALTKYGDLIARKGTLGGWTIVSDQLHSDAGNATLHAGARPYLGMGATVYGDTGFWAGKDTDYIYKVSIGEAGGSMFLFDGSDLTLQDIDLKMYNGTQLTLWIENDGDFSIGSDIETASGTTLKIFSNDQSWDSEAFTGGDIIIGDHSGAHVFWDESAGQLQFRDGGSTGIPVQVYIDTDGSFMAADGDVRIDDTGIMQVSPNSDTGRSLFYWMSEDSNREVARIESWSRNPAFSAPYQDVLAIYANLDEEADHYGIILLQTFSNYGTYADGFFSLNGGTGVNLYWDSKYIIKVTAGATDVWECEIPELQFQQASTIATAAGALALSPATVVQIDTWLELAELNTDVPTTGEPGTGWGAIFVKTDGKVYFKNDGGTEYDLTQSGGSSEWTDDAGGFLYPTETDDQVLIGNSTMVGDDLFNMARANSPTTGTPVYPGMSMWRGSGLVRSRWIGIGTVDNYIGNYLTSNVYYDSGWLHDDVGRTGSIFSIHEGSTTSFDFRYMEATTGASPIRLLTIYNDTGGVVINDDGGDRDFRVEGSSVDTIKSDASADMVQFKNWIELVELGTGDVPSTGEPGTGFGAIYVRADGKVYFKNDGGTEYDLTDTGAAGYWSQGTGVLYPTYDEDIEFQAATEISTTAGALTLNPTTTLEVTPNANFAAGIDVTGNITVTGTLAGLTQQELGELANIGATAISSTQWIVVGGLNQGLTTSSDVQFGTIDSGGINTTADIDVTGSITLTGTVDGKDVAGHVDDSTIHFTTPVEDAAYGTGWNSDATHAPSQNAVFDKIDAMDTLISANTTTAEVESIIDAELVNGQSIDLAIDSLISTHASDDDAHHAKYTDAEVETVITAELVDGQSIDNTIDSLISTHTSDDDAHHAKYTDSEALAQAQTRILDGAYPTSWDADTTHAPSRNALFDKIDAMDTLIAANTTVTEVEAVITAELVGGQSIDNAIDSLISTHATVTDAHHAKYTDAEVETIITAELVDGQSIDLSIDSLIATHATDDDAHHAKYTDAEVETVITAELVDGQSIDNAIDALIAAHACEWTDDAGGFLYPTETDDQVLIGDSTMVGDDLFNLARANAPTTGTPVYPGMSMWRGSGLVRSRWIGIGTVDNYIGNYLTSNVYYDSGWLHDDVGRTGSILSVHEGSTTSFDFRYMEASTGASPIKLLTIYNDTGGVVINEDGGDRNFCVESDNNVSMLFVDGGNDQVVIGANTNIAGGVFEVVAEEIQGNQMSLFGYHTTGNAYPGMTTYGARGTRAAPSQTQSGDWLMNFGGRGWESTNPDWTTTRALMYAEALDNFTSTVAGAKMVFQTSKSGQYDRNAALVLGDEIAFNEDGLDTNFRIESDDLDDAWFMDGATGQWYMGGQSGADNTFALGLQAQDNPGTGIEGLQHTGIVMGNLEGSGDAIATWQYFDYKSGGWEADFNVLGLNIHYDKDDDTWVRPESALPGAVFELYITKHTTLPYFSLFWVEADTTEDQFQWISGANTEVVINGSSTDLDFIVKDDAGASAIHVDAGTATAKLYDLQIKGAGTSFPGSPATNDVFYRTDLGWMCYYDGTRWLTTTEFAMSFTSIDDASTGASVEHSLRLDYAPYVTRIAVESYVSGTNDGSNYWTFTIRGSDEASTSHSTIHTYNTSAHTGSTWTSEEGVPGTSQAPANKHWIGMIFAKTLSPGNLYADLTAYYRLIVT